jgi:type IV pilus assembly protein PilA
VARGTPAHVIKSEGADVTPQRFITRSHKNRDGGFTLVELMVVVMIIAILMAIAIPTFLNSRKRAQDSAAKSNVRNALAASQSVYSEAQSYVGVTTTSLAAEEPSLTFVANTVASAAPKEISVKVSGTDTVYLTSKSDSGKCFALRHSVASGATAGTFQAELTTCTADAASAATGVTWTAL